MYRVEPLSHTADVGYEITADSLSELFVGAAAGLVRALRPDAGEETGALPDAGGPGGGGGGGEETLSLEGPDRERLLVAWLRELLYRMDGGDRVPAGLDVRMTGPSALRARIRWSEAGAGEAPEREIKGVTYHGLHVGEDEEGRWHARLVLDV